MLSAADKSVIQCANRVDQKGFKHVMGTFFDKDTPLDTQLLHRMYIVFDIDGDGLIELKEIITGLSQLLRGTISEKAHMYFRIFDLNGDGGLSLPELYKTLCLRGMNISVT
jgi:Ca2+-binding EF-hand superfamily protein